MLGCGNRLPARLGGSPSRIERIYVALQRMMGTHGASKDVDSIEGRWRIAKAIALAAIESFDERAAMQAFPNKATDYIGLYEDLVGLFAADGTPDVTRRIDSTTLYTSFPCSCYAELEAQLQAVDARVSITMVSRARQAGTIPGRAFEELDAASGNLYDPTVGTFENTEWPNYADAQHVRIFFNLGVAPGPAELATIEILETILRKNLPSSADFVIYTVSGFLVDVSPLGWAAL